jgi:signal transduction histidine kinase
LPNESPAAAVLEALGFALLVRGENGSLRLSGTAPDWLRQLWPALGKSEAEFPIADASPFFENFLIDAEECWRTAGDQRARSGPWIERDPSGTEVEVEATAMTADGRSILLLERLGADFAAKKDVLQRARETVIAHQRLNSEIQKKEILLHYVADEMTTALANVITSMRLIEREDNPPRTKVLLGLAARGTQQQQTLINRVLAVFAEEIGNIYGGEGKAGGGADWNKVIASALDGVAAQFAERKVRLVRPALEGEFRIAADGAHLQRVVAGLLENAFERTPAGGAVMIVGEEETESMLLRVNDSGPRLSAAATENVFSHFELPPSGAPTSALRLHFCRIVIESCDGEIGYEPGATGGNSFWFRLPKSVTA